jgi:hypothetical protein
MRIRTLRRKWKRKFVNTRTRLIILWKRLSSNTNYWAKNVMMQNNTILGFHNNYGKINEQWVSLLRFDTLLFFL